MNSIEVKERYNKDEHLSLLSVNERNTNLKTFLKYISKLIDH